MKVFLLIEQIKVNAEGRYVASQNKVKHTVGGLLKPDGSLTVDDRVYRAGYIMFQNYLLCFLHCSNFVPISFATPQSLFSYICY